MSLQAFNLQATTNIIQQHRGVFVISAARYKCQIRVFVCIQGIIYKSVAQIAAIDRWLKSWFHAEINFF